MENPFVNYKKIIAETNSNHYNVRDEYKNNSYEENIAICNKEKLKFSVGVINVTGCLNIGMMVRSACLFGAENFYIFGRKKFDRRSTVGAENYINIVQYVFDDPIHADELILQDLRKLNEKHSIVLKLLGETPDNKPVLQPVNVKMKPKCVTCGKLNKAKAKFCTECGTALEIFA